MRSSNFKFGSILAQNLKIRMIFKKKKSCDFLKIRHPAAPLTPKSNPKFSARSRKFCLNFFKKCLHLEFLSEKSPSVIFRLKNRIFLRRKPILGQKKSVTLREHFLPNFGPILTQNWSKLTQICPNIAPKMINF